MAGEKRSRGEELFVDGLWTYAAELWARLAMRIRKVGRLDTITAARRLFSFVRRMGGMSNQRWTRLRTTVLAILDRRVGSLRSSERRG